MVSNIFLRCAHCLWFTVCCFLIAQRIVSAIGISNCKDVGWIHRQVSHVVLLVSSSRLYVCAWYTVWCSIASVSAHFPAVFLIEAIIDHVASALRKCPEDVRFANLYQRNQISLAGQKLLYCNISKLWQGLNRYQLTCSYFMFVVSALLQSCNFEQRNAAVLSFNTVDSWYEVCCVSVLTLILLQMNRWKKRALAVVPLRYGLRWHNHYTVLVVIYAKDGTVAITHGGVEFGQGANTKVHIKS